MRPELGREARDPQFGAFCNACEAKCELGADALPQGLTSER